MRQSRPIETLALMKNPPVFARQANIAHGPQQVNNGGVLRAEVSAPAPNELLEAGNGERLDSGTAGATIGSDPALEAVGTRAGPGHSGRQGEGKPERV